MFDTYRPAKEQKCPVCGSVLSDWQGKDSSCSLFVWEEGIAWPTKQEANDMNVSDEERENVRLPETFVIRSYDCDCPYPVEAICETKNGTWASTKIIDFTLAKQRKDERKEEFKKRLKWLDGKTT